MQAGLIDAYDCIAQSSILSDHGSAYALIVNRYEQPKKIYAIAPDLTVTKATLPASVEYYHYQLPMLPNRLTYIHDKPMTGISKDIRLGQTYYGKEARQNNKPVKTLYFNEKANKQEIENLLHLIEQSIHSQINWLSERWNHHVKLLSDKIKTCHRSRDDYGECIDLVHQNNQELERTLKKFHKQFNDFKDVSCQQITKTHATQQHVLIINH